MVERGQSTCFGPKAHHVFPATKALLQERDLLLRPRAALWQQARDIWQASGSLGSAVAWNSPRTCNRFKQGSSKTEQAVPDEHCSGLCLRPLALYSL